MLKTVLQNFLRRDHVDHARFFKNTWPIECMKKKPIKFDFFLEILAVKLGLH